MNINVTDSASSQIISHQILHDSFDACYAKLQDKILTRGNLPTISANAQLQLLKELSQFPLGRFLIENKGLNGEMTQYILEHPDKGRQTKQRPDGSPLTDLEVFLLDRAPVILATQQRCKIFQIEIQKRCVGENKIFVSTPCGTLHELLFIDSSQLNNFELIGVDLDVDSIQKSQQAAIHHPLKNHIKLVQDDSWNFTLRSPCDLLISNGLNIYVQEDDKLLELYQNFYNQIKPGGELITSMLTPPPPLTDRCEWEMSQINPKDAFKQKVIFGDVLESSWQYYRSTETTVEQLESVGFTDIQVIYDQAHIFPTFVAKKPN